MPDEWLEPVPGAETPDAVRAAYVSFLVARLGTRQWLPEGPPRIARGPRDEQARLPVRRPALRARASTARSSSTSAWCSTATPPTSSTSPGGSTGTGCTAFDPSLDLDQVCEALAFVEGVCAGDERGGAAAAAPISQRFGFVKAPRSTVLQPGPVHGGVTPDPARQLDHLVEKLVG